MPGTDSTSNPAGEGMRTELRYTTAGQFLSRHDTTYPLTAQDVALSGGSVHAYPTASDEYVVVIDATTSDLHNELVARELAELGGPTS